jgi:hypothetical protein
MDTFFQLIEEYRNKSNIHLGVAADRSGPRYPLQVLTADRSGSGLSVPIANANSVHKRQQEASAKSGENNDGLVRL